MDEFDFINKLKPSRMYNKHVKVGIGDDAAVFETTVEYNQVVCVDTMVEGVHFLKHLSSPHEIGYKALAVNVSDIAAMGGIPLYYLVSIAIPSNWEEQELLGIYEGMRELADLYKMDLIGGDTVSTSDKLVITVTVIGEAENNVKTLRNQARDGDVIFVTGTIGDSSSGLAILINQVTVTSRSTRDFLISRHKMPTPQVQAGRLIARLERAALNDVSDGLASELNEISEASKVGMTIHENLLPMSDQLQSLKGIYDIKKSILFGGEDFELVGTTSAESWENLKRACKEQKIKITKIGYVTSEHTGVRLKSEDQTTTILKKSGYNHFKK